MNERSPCDNQMAGCEAEPTPERPAGGACDRQFVAECRPMQIAYPVVRAPTTVVGSTRPSPAAQAMGRSMTAFGRASAVQLRVSNKIEVSAVLGRSRFFLRRLRRCPRMTVAFDDTEQGVQIRWFD